jgi:hypothetical protein
VVLFTDACIVTETPPLRAGWAPVGRQAEVPIIRKRAKRTAYCALAVDTGSVRLDVAGRWNQDTRSLLQAGSGRTGGSGKWRS